jgi:alpha-D-ribose 1-methylphosphonate 5-triphosphate synthase subunit PhnG
MGDAPASALLAAVVDALGRSERADLRAAVAGALAEARAALPSEREREGNLAAGTRVAFETMPEG